MPIWGWKDEQNVVHTYSGSLFSLENEGNSSCHSYNVDNPYWGHYIKWNKPVKWVRGDCYIWSVSSTKLLKLLEFAVMRTRKMSLDMLMSGFGKHLRMGEPTKWFTWFKNWNCHSQSPQPNLWGGGGLKVELVTKGQWFNQSCLWNDASIKIWKGKFQRASRLVNRWRFGEGGELALGEGVDAPDPFPMPCLPAVAKLYPFAINWYSSK